MAYHKRSSIALKGESLAHQYIICCSPKFTDQNEHKFDEKGSLSTKLRLIQKRGNGKFKFGGFYALPNKTTVNGRFVSTISDTPFYKDSV